MPTTDRLVYAARYARRAMAEPRPDGGAASPPPRTGPTLRPGPTTASPPPGSATPRCCSTSRGTWVVTDPVLERRIGLGRGFAKLGPRRADHAGAREAGAAAAGTACCSRTPTWITPTSARCGRFPRGCASSSSRAIATSCAASTPWTSPAWGETATVGDLEVESVETRHWGARMVTDRHRGWGRLSVAERLGRTVLFGGDTAYTDAFNALVSAARSISPFCRSAPTTPGSRATPRPRRPGGCSAPWEPIICSPSTTPRSG